MIQYIDVDWPNAKYVARELRKLGWHASVHRTQVPDWPNEWRGRATLTTDAPDWLAAITSTYSLPLPKRDIEVPA